VNKESNCDSHVKITTNTPDRHANRLFIMKALMGCNTITLSQIFDQHCRAEDRLIDDMERFATGIHR